MLTPRVLEATVHDHAITPTTQRRPAPTPSPRAPVDQLAPFLQLGSMAELTDVRDVASIAEWGHTG